MNFTEVSRRLAMGVFDSLSVDRHDHDQTIEGNVYRVGGDGNVSEERVIVVVLCVLLVLIALFFGVKYMVDRCVML